MDFQSYICFDGVPPLWPKAPTWPSDKRLKERLTEELSSTAKLPVQILEMLCTGRQRRSDECWGHLVYLVRQYDSNEKKTIDEWAKLLLPTCEVYIRPQVPIPRKCDECNKPCTSECMCGESFCSRACLKKSWGSHKSICEAVFENASLEVLLTNMEMLKTMTLRERQIAEGIINDEQEAARIELRKFAGDTPEMRTFSRMRLNGDGPIMPKEKGIMVHPNITNKSYELSFSSTHPYTEPQQRVG
eukprot:gene31172-40530_t